MTRKDFELIAGVLANTSRVEQESRRILAVAFADALQFTNPNFDRERFVAAALRNDSATEIRD